MTNEKLDNLVKFPLPEGALEEPFNDIREAGRLFAQVVADSTPPGSGQNTALWMIRQAAIQACEVLSAKSAGGNPESQFGQAGLKEEQ